MNLYHLCIIICIRIINDIENLSNKKKSIIHDLHKGIINSVKNCLYYIIYVLTEVKKWDEHI